MNETQIISILSNENTKTILFISLFAILIVSKIAFRLTINKNLNSNRFLKVKSCPFCDTKFDRKEKYCKACAKEPDKNQRIVICYNCGYIGEKDLYSKNSEYVVTFFLLFALGVLPGLIYILIYSKKRICRNCGRMTRMTDFKGI